MTDLDLLTGTIAARIRAMPQVHQLYPPRPLPPSGSGGSAQGLIAALSSDDTVTARLEDGTTHLEVTLAVAAGAAAPATVRAVATEIGAALDAASVHDRRITVRIASIDG